MIIGRNFLSGGQNTSKRASATLEEMLPSALATELSGDYLNPESM